MWRNNIPSPTPQASQCKLRIQTRWEFWWWTVLAQLFALLMSWLWPRKLGTVNALLFRQKPPVQQGSVSTTNGNVFAILQTVFCSWASLFFPLRQQKSTAQKVKFFVSVFQSNADCVSDGTQEALAPLVSSVTLPTVGHWLCFVLFSSGNENIGDISNNVVFLHTVSFWMLFKCLVQRVLERLNLKKVFVKFVLPRKLVRHPNNSNSGKILCDNPTSKNARLRNKYCRISS